eukprot:8287314-Lingulodinium_polyedra.AAC.1
MARTTLTMATNGGGYEDNNDGEYANCTDEEGHWFSCRCFRQRCRRRRCDQRSMSSASFGARTLFMDIDGATD